MSVELMIKVPNVDAKKFVIDPSILKPEGVSVGTVSKGGKSIGFEAEVIICISIATPTTVASISLAKFLIELFRKQNPKSIEIDRQTTEFKEGEIERVVREKIKVKY